MKKTTPLFVLLLALLLAALCPSAEAQKKKRKPNPALQPIEDVAGLPRVLLIGDSISIGYTLPVRALMKGKANVHRPRTNCGPTTRGLSGIDDWLGDKKWDVIHFNWGLHDLKYMARDGKLADPKAPGSHQQVPPAEYEKNLRTLVDRLKKTGAKLIWCSTTPVPEGSNGRLPGDAAKYNAIAAKVMADHQIPTDDLYTFAKARLKEIQRPANVHFSSAGSKALAQQVADSISKALAQ